MQISDAAVDLIIAEEVSDRAYYLRHYQHFDWPGGASGPTVGIGYDCGYVTKAELIADWTGIVPDATIAALLQAVGRKGQAAAAWVEAHRTSVTIGWDAAVEQFRTRELAKWWGRTAAALPGLERLPPDCAGALVSLAYNRGCSFDLGGDRYREMRAIKAALLEDRLDDIPEQLRAMARLWSNGVAGRRRREAALFERGLATLARPGLPQAVAQRSRPGAAETDAGDVAVPPLAAAFAPAGESEATSKKPRDQVTAADLRPHSRTIAEQMRAQAEASMQAAIGFGTLVTTFVASVVQPVKDAVAAIGPLPILCAISAVALGFGVFALVRARRTIAYRVEDTRTGRHVGWAALFDIAAEPSAPQPVRPE